MRKYKVLEELSLNAMNTSLVYDLWSDDFGIVYYEIYLDQDTGEMFLSVQTLDDAWTKKLFLIESIND
jgi:hypothetical protein